VEILDAVLLAYPQNPSGIVGGRRRLVAKDVNVRGVRQCVGEGQRAPECLGASYRCLELIEGPIRVAEHPGNERQVALALHAGVGTRPIRELHVRIEHLEAPPTARKCRLEFPLEEQHRAECQVPPEETGRIVKPFGRTHRLLRKMLSLLHLE
jgi:hypothetical protein